MSNMSNGQIVLAAIKKASENGFVGIDTVTIFPNEILGYNESIATVFSHSFAKAFWGEEWYCSECRSKSNSYYTAHRNGVRRCYGEFTKLWQHFLQQMVLEEDPIKYLEQFI